MNQNKFLSLINTVGVKHRYTLNPKADGAIEFNGLLLDIVESENIPLTEKVNYLYIAFSNIMELLSKDFNGLAYYKMEYLTAMVLNILYRINQISHSLNYQDYPHPQSKISFTSDIEGKQPVLYRQVPWKLVGCRNQELKTHWFDGTSEIPLTFFRDFSFSFLMNEIWHHQDVLMNDLDIMAKSKIRIIVAWVGNLPEPVLQSIRYVFQKHGFMIIFMDVNLFNAAHIVSELPKFQPIQQAYIEYDYFDKHAFERIVRVPKESFEEVVDFYAQAAKHPDVTDIFISFYRANIHGRLVQTLIDATHAGKFVHIYIELSARGDEFKNMELVKKLQAECDLNYLRLECSYFGIKIHAKIGMVYMKDGRTICHIGTGNFNENTAKIYTDIHRITDDAEDIGQVEEAFTAMVRKVPIKQKIKDILIWEIRNQTAFGTDGRIMLKCNHAIDDDLVRELQRAEACGVTVKTIIRTSPGVDTSITTMIGQKLEHERVYCFGNGDHVHVYISSSDLMFRNLYKRMEIMTQIKTPEIAKEIMKELWDIA